jgi:hypothetical protein
MGCLEWDASDLLARANRVKNIDTRSTCPDCGGALIPVCYGMPSRGMMEASMRGEIALGGCCITDRDPDVECPACERRFFSEDLLVEAGVEKLVAQAGTLLDHFVGLSAREAMLDPMLDSDAVRDSWGRGDQGTGFTIIRTSLLLSCAMEIVNLTLDRDSRTASIETLIKGLRDDAVRNRLRRMFAVRDIGSLADLPDDVHEAVAETERHGEDRRKREFDELVEQLISGAETLQESDTLENCRTLRNKVIAHAETIYGDSGYAPLDVGALGLTWSDLRTTISELRSLVRLVTIVFRAAAFDFEMLDGQLSEASAAFWRPPAPPGS